MFFVPGNIPRGILLCGARHYMVSARHRIVGVFHDIVMIRCGNKNVYTHRTRSVFIEEGNASDHVHSRRLVSPIGVVLYTVYDGLRWHVNDRRLVFDRTARSRRRAAGIKRTKTGSDIIRFPGESTRYSQGRVT